METIASKHFTTARKKLSEAKLELFRPKEDVVSFLVCQNSQRAIENYLKGYLLSNKVSIGNSNTIDKLYNQCLLINDKFKKLDLSDFLCNKLDINSKHCTDVPKVINCFSAAENLDDFLRKEKIID